jgi:hypothetical protein
MADIDKLFNRLDLLLDRIEKIVPGQVENKTEPGFSAYRWSYAGLEGISRFDQVELLHLKRQ